MYHHSSFTIQLNSICFSFSYFGLPNFLPPALYHCQVSSLESQVSPQVSSMYYSKPLRDTYFFSFPLHLHTHTSARSGPKPFLVIQSFLFLESLFFGPWCADGPAELLSCSLASFPHPCYICFPPLFPICHIFLFPSIPLRFPGLFPAVVKRIFSAHFYVLFKVWMFSSFFFALYSVFVSLFLCFLFPLLSPSVFFSFCSCHADRGCTSGSDGG
ncbi:hypothetical protein BOTBODRAFT_330145 [Botryobasidium botryosum FD-172 SS1]|uniref:Uncharacterized protein n=1 Tax=Botryobasidium botryosum (strain FD-172 SS1) TaxID=930990 RepID=A0A067MGB1_BOTB1|nr:hypothetical protein BOTBODRAFT_330145 [Botryobasidium botryosum FD-172 SS1]